MINFLISHQILEIRNYFPQMLEKMYLTKGDRDLIQIIEERMSVRLKKIMFIIHHKETK